MWLAWLVACADSPFVQAATSHNLACGLQESGHVDCWGAISGVDRKPPRGRFVMIGLDYASGDLYTLHDRGELLLRRPSGERTAYPGRFVYLEGTCGVLEDGGVACSPDARVEGDYVRADSVCALDADGGGWTWGGGGAVAGGPWADLSCIGDPVLGGAVICGLRRDGGLDCEGAPGGVFVEVAIGTTQRCAIDDSGGVACWTPAGPIDTAELGSGPFENLVPNGPRMCAVAGGAAVCWRVEPSLDYSDPAVIELM